mmetsp:Transcript_16440/g.22720  ORF Transcript_16440/g.22720 Transcript_16440/m.22720 type:complete len:226 (-) Transcript_16440:115-792(-)|eukprot:CAMPEP_0196592622 /NCGR_PEP_ID=MMETSP1081-20130531/73284_1 /TAXON_ID=36882 /ORGANISM="Pyramimonas amylifera, Strain CCMP720" /LENGTH=225 /DNA_ID=CAMNT_0041916369 /DNA_START=52 /DNA_END=729 /DNA_ORIENTATION=+
MALYRSYPKGPESQSIYSRVLFACIALLIFGSEVRSLEFDLLDRSNSKDPGAKCILEEMNQGVLVLLEFSTADGTLLAVKLEDPMGSVLWTPDPTAGAHFGFTTEHAGDYTICFTKADPGAGGAISHKVKLEWKTGVAATDWDNIAKRDRVDAMAMSLRELEAEIKEIHEGMLYLRQREEEMRDLNESTNARVAWLSVLSLGICVGMSTWQLFYLKRFFVRKKLL